jgi:GH24 family phage-related lysozyme (muramidase)
MNLKSSQAAIDLIVAEEVSSEATYQKLYQHPEWPGGMSGVTIGIGYDVGYSTPETIQADWGDKLPAAMVHALQAVAGIHGSPASSHAHALHGVVTVPFEAAMAVFRQRDMPKWEQIVAHALPNTQLLAPDSFGALVSLAYNRGASFSAPGDRYQEMRGIRLLMGAQQFDRIPDEFRSMKRLWPNVLGLRLRRDHEAALFEQGLKAMAGA